MSGWHHGRTVLCARRSSRGEGVPHRSPEAVEGVAVVCCCSSVGLVSVAAALLLMCWRGGRHGSRAKEEQGKGRKGKDRKEEKNSEEKE